MQKWQYKVLSCYWNGNKWVWHHDEKEQRGVAELLNGEGLGGWELVAAHSWLTQLWQPGGGQPAWGPSNTVCNYILKRPA